VTRELVVFPIARKWWISTSVISKLATSLNRRDEEPNVKLAQQIAAKSDAKAVRELVDNLASKDRGIQADCIKVLYEVGERKPALIAGYSEAFGDLLASKNNRLVWGAMTALDTIASEVPDEVDAMLPRIIRASDQGSVIAKDHAVGILIKLSSAGAYADKSFNLLIQQLKVCPTNQLPMYAEQALPIVDKKRRGVFVSTLSSRLKSIEKESKRKRAEKVIRKLSV
jgi:hypothetical protein